MDSGGGVVEDYNEVTMGDLGKTIIGGILHAV